MSDRRWQLVGGYEQVTVESEGYVARMRGLYTEDCPFREPAVAEARDSWLAGWLRAEREVEAVAETNRLRGLAIGKGDLIGYFETMRGHSWRLIERIEALGHMEASMLVRAAQYNLNEALSLILAEK